VYVYRFQNYSRGVFIIYAALLMLFLVGSRASFRLISEFAHRRSQKGQRVLIYGTGDVATIAARDMLSRREGGYRMLGYIDDDPTMVRSKIQGYTVLGGFAVLAGLIENDGVDLVAITQLMDVDRLEQLRELCIEHQVSLERLHLQLDKLVAAS
jgi:UDP-GlcNAc:undecaprenyl-phosphate GlcNAc-1-phosphate transferase